MFLKYLKYILMVKFIHYKCKKYHIKKYKINLDCTVDVFGEVNLAGLRLKSLPVSFGKVHGDFFCHANRLTTLKGSPTYVDGCFFCTRNKLTSLKHAPSYIEASLYTNENNLITIEGCPEYVGMDISFGNINKRLSVYHLGQYKGAVLSRHKWKF